MSKLCGSLCMEENNQQVTMRIPQLVEAEGVSTTRENDPLQTKYYCKVDKSGNMDVNMELKALGGEIIHRVPIRHVLVIDISKSMDESVGNDSTPLLKRVKLFIKLAIRKMSENDSLSIVTFADSAEITLPMTRMTKPNKEAARNIVRALQTKGRSTNIEDGLMKGLTSINSGRTYGACREGIILFTDGVPNTGLKDPDKLVQQYRTVQSKSKCVPLSALTLGGYQPRLLIEISRHLGSDAFMWLNDEMDFETDMLLPIFLREETTISDISIHMFAQIEVHFKLENNDTYRTNVTNNKMKVKVEKKVKKVRVPTELQYFIHTMTNGSLKNIPLELVLPEDRLQELDGQCVVLINISYLDASLKAHTFTDYLTVRTRSLLQANRTTTSIQISAFIIQNNKQRNSAEDDQNVILKLLEQKCKSLVLASLQKTVKQFSDHNTQVSSTGFHETLKHLQKIRQEGEKMLDPEKIAILNIYIDEWSSRITFAIDLTANDNGRNFSRLHSMASSIAKETPTGRGVFKDHTQPFMNREIKEKLDKIADSAKKVKFGPQRDVREEMQHFSKHTSHGNIKLMEEHYDVLQSLAVIEDVEESFLQHAQAEIKHRKELNQVKSAFEDPIAKENIAEMENLIQHMKLLMAKDKLTTTKDDFKVMEEAMKKRDLFLLKRSLRAEIACTNQELSLPLIPQNMGRVNAAIEKMSKLKEQSQQYDDVFTKSDLVHFNTTVVKYNIAKATIGGVMREMPIVLSLLKSPPIPENYETIKEGIKKLMHLQEISAEFVGLFTKREENVLETSLKNLKDLEANRSEIISSINELIPTLTLPMVPENYEKMRESVMEMKNIKEEATRYKDLFTEEHQNILDSASSSVNILKKKMEDIIIKTAEAVHDATLPMLPASLEKIKAAVSVMSEAKEEAKGFDGVFTEEDNLLLEKGVVSVKILEEKKQEIIKALDEAVPNIQLPMLPMYYEKIIEGIKTMETVMDEAKGFGLYQDEYDEYLKKAIFNAEVLKEKMNELKSQLANIKRDLNLSLIPDNLSTMQKAVDSMKIVKVSSEGFKDVFTELDDVILTESVQNVDELRKKVEKATVAREQVQKAYKERDFYSLDYAIKRASRATFVRREELIEPRRLANFLNPRRRRSAVKNGIRDEDITAIENGLMNMKEAAVVDDKLTNKANRVLKVLRERKRKEEKERRRREREEARRQKEIKFLTDNLSIAMMKEDIESLEEALQEIDDSPYGKEEIPTLDEAKELLEELKIAEMKERLENAINARNITVLLDTIIDADFGGYVKHMEREYEEAKELLVYLREMMALRDAIVRMTRSSITEIHCYRHPPRAIHRIMIAIYIILGESPEELRKWNAVQALLGRLDNNSITKKIRRFQIDDVTLEMAEAAEFFLQKTNLQEMQEISTEATSFYAWAKYVVKEVFHLKEEKEKVEMENEEANAMHLENQFDSEEEKGEREEITDTSEEEDDIPKRDDAKRGNAIQKVIAGTDDSSTTPDYTHTK